MGCLEHFFVAGPYNVFDVGSGHWVLPFDISVALLVVVQVGVSLPPRACPQRALEAFWPEAHLECPRGRGFEQTPDNGSYPQVRFGIW